ncbi:G-alpha-domain-containing protein [Fistulina hepatica ATCC 64428]|uniref:G-alpha-domain-containing protein n=1 Tax=Fistulina hepatica ATCC 64428 TaxID=1128425 RepID=A0A0D7A301_9AGAR|nr:G-alpha-domain-containing protein [Fistulina hepatica ATCC 64428]
MLPSRRRGDSSVWPPLDTAPQNEVELSARLAQEEEARRISDDIDMQLKAEREQRRRSGVKILLLGQAESGKSTILKNFQLHFAPHAFQVDSEVWRPVIHLNLVRSVNFIRNLLRTPFDERVSLPALSEELRTLNMRLAPLGPVEEGWIKLISPEYSCGAQLPTSPSRYDPRKASEINVRSGGGWKFRRSKRASFKKAFQEDTANRCILSACAEDITSLWKSTEAQTILRLHDIQLSEQPGFFLDDVQRIADQNYKPTPEDILRARVHTVGPEEHHIVMETPFEFGKDWTIYDVGGSRSQRAVWAQFFDDVHVVIFLAPISAFNQYLAEEPTVNRLSDTLNLWKTLCSNRLLSRVEFILFLNKLDILEAKLNSGVKFRDYVTSYKQRPNEVKPVSKYLLDVFNALHAQNTPRKRPVHTHTTCAIDTHATGFVITQIQEVILLKSLSETYII